MPFAAGKARLPAFRGKNPSAKNCGEILAERFTHKVRQLFYTSGGRPGP